MSAELLQFLVEGLLASSAACALVLVLRPLWRHVFGATAVPALWALVPIALLAVALPARVQPVDAMAGLKVMANASQATAQADTTMASGVGVRELALPLWLLGSAVSGALFFRQQRRFRQRLGRLVALEGRVQLAAHADVGPAVLGLLRPRIVLPADFNTRYSREEQALILSHERSHLRRGDIIANAVATALRSIYWFNPLIHYAAGRMRHDHELASDADVLRQHPDSRRRYAETLLNVQLAVPGLPVGCLWQSSHPLKERILMLKHSPASPALQRLGLAASIALIALGAGAAWAAQPARQTASGGDAPPAVPDAPVSYASLSPPKYPKSAIDAKQAGNVVLRVQVGEDGMARTVEIERADLPGVFDAAAIAAVKSWKFNPARKDGAAAESWVRVPICFSLDEQAECPAVPEALDGIYIKG